MSAAGSWCSLRELMRAADPRAVVQAVREAAAQTPAEDLERAARAVDRQQRRAAARVRVEAEGGTWTGR